MTKDNGNAVATVDPGAIIEQVIAKGDLKNLSPSERAMYYRQTCESMGLNPLTKPFQYITLNGQLTLYAARTAADQLRKINGVTLVSLDRHYDKETEMYEVAARMRDREGREDEDIAAVFVGNLKGDALGNAMKKAVTQAKRRCTLSLCGLGWLDESEIEQIPEARRASVSSYVPDDEPVIDIAEAEYQVDGETGEIVADDNDLGQSIIDEYLAAIYAAESKAELVSIGERLRDSGLSSDDLREAYSSRLKELTPAKAARQTELVTAGTGSAGDDHRTR